MIAALIALLVGPPATRPAPAPLQVVRVWLDQRAPLNRGMSVRVYVEAGQDGNLVVLHRRTDGRVEALFPRLPGNDPFVRAGTYEIRGRDDQAAWVVAEPDGTGMILAALSPDPLRFDEFVHAAAWNEDALATNWSGAEPEGALSDIVQRMLGDGALSYDVVSYTVAPPVYALQDGAPSDGVAQIRTDTMPSDQPDQACPNCQWNGVEYVVMDPFYALVPFFGVRPFEPNPAPPAPPPMQVLALTLGARPGEAPGALQFASPTHSVSLLPHVPARPTPVAPRPRTPTQPTHPADVPGAARPMVRPLPAVPGHRTELASRGPLTHVRFTRLSTPTAEAPRTSADTRRAGSEMVDGGTSEPVSARERVGATIGAARVDGAAPGSGTGTHARVGRGRGPATPEARPPVAGATAAPAAVATPLVLPPASARSAGVGGGAAAASRGAARSSGVGRRR